MIGRYINKAVRGAALIIVMGFAVIAFMMSVILIQAGIHQTSGSVTENWQTVAKQGSQWGIESVIYYMSFPGNWNMQIDGFNTFSQLNPDPASIIQPFNPGANPNSVMVNLTLINPVTMNFDFNAVGAPSAYSYSLASPDPSVGPDDPLGLNRSPVVVVRVQLEAPVNNTNSLRVFYANAITTVFTNPAGVGDPNQVLATNSSRAEIKEHAPTDYSHYLANARSFDGYGFARSGAVDYADPNSGGAANAVRIGKNHVESGRMAVTGIDEGTMDPNNAYDLYSGSIQLQDAESADMRFNRSFSTAYGSDSAASLFVPNMDNASGLVNIEDVDRFRRGAVQDQGYSGLPTTDVHLGEGDFDPNADPADNGLMRHAAADTEDDGSGQNYTSGLIPEMPRDIISKAATAYADSLPSDSFARDAVVPEFEVLIDGDTAKINLRAPSENYADTEADRQGQGLSSFWNDLASDPDLAPESVDFINSFPREVNIEELKNGTLYFEGGNVSVRNANQDSGIKDSLSIVSSVSPNRRDTVGGVDAQDSLFNPLMRAYYDYNIKQRRENGVPGPNFIAPPYSMEDIRNDPEFGQGGTPTFEEAFQTAMDTKTTAPGSLDSPDKKLHSIVYDMNNKYEASLSKPPEQRSTVDGYYIKRGEIFDQALQELPEMAQWQGPEAAVEYFQPDTNPTPKPAEGNLGIVGDLKKGQGGEQELLGLYAENYILLNDRTATTKSADPQKQATLEVDAVMFSFDHSVQLDTQNIFRNQTTISGPSGEVNFADYAYTPDAQKSPDALALAESNRFKGNFNYNGSIIGRFSDVEGDSAGNGYVNQNFVHDAALKYRTPPMAPSFNYADFSNPQESAIRWIILSIDDTSQG